MNIAIPKGNSKWFFLTNDGLKIGDPVFPLLETYHNDGKVFVTGMPRIFVKGPSDSAEFIEACTGWPSSPHVIRKFYTEDGIDWIRTDKGYAPAIEYFKLI